MCVKERQRVPGTALSVWEEGAGEQLCHAISLPLSLSCLLQMSSAKEPLAGHPQLLKCLEQIEEERMFNELLANGELVWRLYIRYGS